MKSREQRAAEVGHRIDWIGEELLELGMNPDEIENEAYLTARNQFTSGRIEEDELIAMTKRLTKILRARDGWET